MKGPRFTDVTQQAGLGGFVHETGAEGGKLFPESMGSGCAFIDFDGDNWPDILVAGGGTWPGGKKKPVPAVRLYRNNRDGTFADVTGKAGLADIHTYSDGFAVADYDNDGDQDFFLTTLYENMLFRNDGGVFSEVGKTAGVNGPSEWSTSAVFFDADRDGNLDLYVANYVAWSVDTDLFCTIDGVNKDYCTPQAHVGIPGRFYHNRGDGTFEEQTREVGLSPSKGKSLGVADIDFNEDGWPDLIVANDTEPNELFVNRGDGTFEEKGLISGIGYDENGKALAGMGIDVGVVDTTGRVSLFIGHFSHEMIGVYRYEGNDLWLDRSATSKIGRVSMLSLTFGLFLFDTDLDGDLDLFTANGHVQPDVEKAEGIPYAQPAHLFINDGNGSFRDITPEVKDVLSKPVVARGAAFADFDGDGDQDVLLSENAGPLHLWRNDATSGNVIRVRLVGQSGNRDAFGARLLGVVGGRRLDRRKHGGSSYMSASETVPTFGLGEATQLDSLQVFWPMGAVETFTTIPSGQEIVIEEGTGTVRTMRSLVSRSGTAAGKP